MSDLVSAEARFVSIDGLDVRYVSGGGRDGPAILLTSPWPESIYAFRSVWPQLETLGPIVAVDLPGFGRSLGRPDLMSPSAMGSFLVKFAGQLGFERIHAVGPDVGTSALLFAAAAAPGLFESLVVGSASVSLPIAGQPMREIIEAPPNAFASLEGGVVGAAALDHFMSTKPVAAVLEDYRLSSEGGRWAEAAEYIRSYERDLPKLEGVLPSMQCPVLVVAGLRRDRASSQCGVPARQACPVLRRDGRLGPLRLGGCAGRLWQPRRRLGRRRSSDLLTDADRQGPWPCSG